MALCKLSKAAEVDSPGFFNRTIKSISTYFTGVSESEKITAFENKVNDYFVVLGNMKGNSAIQNMLKSSDSITDLDEWTRFHTQGKYNEFKEVMDNKDKVAIDELDSVLTNDLKYLAAVYEDPKGLKTDETLSNEFKTAFLFQYDLIQKGNIGTSILNGDRFNIASDLVVNRSNVFKQYRPVNEAYAELEGINNATRNYLSLAKRYVQSIVDKHTDKTITDEILNRNIQFLDGSFRDGESIIKTRLEEIGFDNEQIAHTIKHLKEFQKDWNIYNYGVAEPDKDYTKEIAMSNQYSNFIEFEGKKIPTFLNFVLNTGNRLNSMVGKRNSELEGVEKEVTKMFGEDGSFSIRRNNYIPSTKEDIMSQLTEPTKFSKLYGDVSFLKQRQTMLEYNEEDPASFTDVFTNNIKSLQHFVSKVSEYSTARIMKDRLSENTEFEQVNSVAYNNIKYFADTIVDDYEKAPDKINPTLQSAKKLGGATAGLLAGTILMNSAPANYAAGAVTMMARLGVTKPWQLRTSYNNALKDSGDKGDVARAVRDFYINYSPFTKLSDQITSDTSMKDIGVNKVMDKISNAALASSDVMVSKGILGVIPGLRWLAFNESENKMMKIGEALAFEKVDRAVNLAKAGAMREGKEFDLNSFVSDYLKKSNEAVFTMTKESLGDFSKYAKPFWSWKMFRDADNVAGTIGGLIGMTGYMFKQVSLVNAHVINRLGHAIRHGGLKSEIAPTASVGAAMGVVLLSLYEWLSDENENIPRVSLLKSASPTGDFMSIAQGIKGGIKALANAPVTEQEAQDISSLFRFIGGIPFGGGMKVDKQTAAGGMMNILDNFSINMDFGTRFFTAAAKGVFTPHTPQGVYDYKNEMTNALARNTILVNTSNDPLKFIRDASTVFNASYSAILSDDPKQKALLSKTATNIATKVAQNMLGLSVYFGPKHYKDTSYQKYDRYDEWNRTRYWKDRSTSPNRDALVYATEQYGYIPRNWILKSELRQMERERQYGN